MEGSGFYVRDYAELTSTAAAQPWWALTFDLVVKLGLVVGLIYVVMWLLRTYLGGKQPLLRAAGRMEVLEASALAPGRSVYLVEVADRVLVLGATSGSLSTLAEITDPAAIELLKKRAHDQDAPPAAFAEQLDAITRRLPATFLQDKVGELRTLAERFKRPAESSS
jgi:flagellar biosynthetic protein FliO